MRAILATPKLRALSRREALVGAAVLPAMGAPDPDAALFAAADALARADAEHEALFERACGGGGNPFADPDLAAATERLYASGHRFARTPALSVRGLALKLRHIVRNVRDGQTAWAEDLARGALADAERIADRT